jgi:hypothetical protein
VRLNDEPQKRASNSCQSATCTPAGKSSLWTPDAASAIWGRRGIGLNRSRACKTAPFGHGSVSARDVSEP